MGHDPCGTPGVSMPHFQFFIARLHDVDSGGCGRAGPVVIAAGHMSMVVFRVNTYAEFVVLELLFWNG